MKHQLEHRLGMHGDGKRISTGHPLVSWLVIWTIEMLLKFRKRPSDGRTSYEMITMITGHECKHPIIEIAEVVMFRTQVDKTNMHKADGGWVEGYFLGIEARSTHF